jgi:hypothetical protein
MKKILKIFGWVLLIAFIGVQFFRPAKNQQTGVAANHISTLAEIPADVNAILEKACNDCHTNNTRYPWYFNVQPVGIWMDNHIKEAKRGVNFSEYTDKRPRYQYHKMEEVIEQVKEKKMPIDSYTWTHKDAVLSEQERTKLIDWANSVMDKLKTQYPIDSLVRKKPS